MNPRTDFFLFLKVPDYFLKFAANLGIFMPVLTTLDMCPLLLIDSHAPIQWRRRGPLPVMPGLATKWVRLAPNGKKWYFLISIFSTFWLREPKCTDLKKSQIFQI